MYCPNCKKEFDKPFRECVCGYRFSDEDYRKLFHYFDLKGEMKSLDLIRENLQAVLERISRKLNEFEEIINREISSRHTPAEMKPEPIQPVQHVPTPTVMPPAEERIKPQVTAHRKQVKSASEGAGLEVNLGQKWLLIIGIITMVFGIGYFLKYSFDKGWVGPAGRVASAYIWGIIFLAAGNRLRKKFGAFGLSMIGGGIATLYFAAFAGFQIYHLFSQAPSFLIMVLITALAASLAVVYDTKWLAILGLLGGFLTPIMLSTGQDNQIFLMSYMAVLNAGILGVAFYKKWDSLNYLGFIATYLLYSGWFARHYAESKFWPAVLFLNLFYFMYTVIPFAYSLFRKHSERAGFLIITPNSFFAFGFSYYMIKHHFSLEWVSVVTILYALVFLSAATYLYQKNMHDREAFSILLGKSALFLVITIPVIFSGHWITVFWSAQAIVLLWTAVRIERKSLIGGAYLLMAVAVGKFLLYDYDQVFRLSFDPGNLYLHNTYTYLIIERFITSFFITGSVYVVAQIAKRSPLSLVSRARDHSIIMGIWGVLLFLVLNIEVSSFFHDYLIRARFAAISVLWAIFSVTLIIKGFRDNSSLIRKTALGLFLVTLLKVFVVDMSNMDTPYRIVSFFILGVVMICASFLYYKFKDRILKAMATDAQSIA